ncbi:MAG: hypothetical protein N4A49_11485 [Marinifilaceae bacterium]|jgi:hypothetical protein|nr:hypothetical protein [Marinifilaceae bacterium]
MKSLKLFNSVLSKSTNQSVFISDKGFIIEAGALWAKSEIIDFYEKENLDACGFNKTFHKSWIKITQSTKQELVLDQIKHYISTYGSEFKDDIYIPNEILEIPKLDLKFKIIKACSRKEMVSKSLNLLQSGIALKEDSIDDILSLLVDDLSYEFTGNEGIKNNEALAKIADLYGIVPKDELSFFRYIIYRTTGKSLIIKNENLIKAIKESEYNPQIEFEEYGLEKLAQIFNRFKVLFLAYKIKCPKQINKISRLSKKYHKPLIENPLNKATSISLNNTHLHWLDNATAFALFRALVACYNRIKGQKIFTYKIRNGKSYVKENKLNDNLENNYNFILNYCKARFNLKNKTFFLPSDIDYALPFSEKMFVGNIPIGTKFYADSLAVGVYWENAWGAEDLDISALGIGEKIGWNSSYNAEDGGLLYSGDITNAPDGAVEYMYANNKLSQAYLIQNNVYQGKNDCGYKIIVGAGDNINYNYMMNPNNLFVETKCQSVQNQSILGILLPYKSKQCFVLLNIGSGSIKVSNNSEITNMAIQSLYQEWNNSFSLKDMIIELGARITNDEDKADYNLSLQNLTKETFLEIFNS